MTLPTGSCRRIGSHYHDFHGSLVSRSSSGFASLVRLFDPCRSVSLAGISPAICSSSVRIADDPSHHGTEKSSDPRDLDGRSRHKSLRSPPHRVCCYPNLSDILSKNSGHGGVFDEFDITDCLDFTVSMSLLAVGRSSSSSGPLMRPSDINHPSVSAVLCDGSPKTGETADTVGCLMSSPTDIRRSDGLPYESVHVRPSSH